jgi:hypothetical protein
MAIRNKPKTDRTTAPAPAKETARERHDRMLAEINTFLADIDAALAECGAGTLAQS